jgi:hypothetical protein
VKPGTGKELSRSAARGKRPALHSEAVILFAVGASTFAIAASAVDEIRNMQGLKPLAHSPVTQAKLARVRNVLVREGKTYFVVDANYHFCMLPSKPTRVLVLRNSPAAILVDAIYALPRAFNGEERRWFRGLALMSLSGRGEGDDVVPVVNPDCFLSAAEQQILESILKAQKSSASGAASA